MSIFHSISAFCNAGFDLMGSHFGPFSSFTGYTGDVAVNIIIMLLILIGGLGFTVLLDIFVRRNIRLCHFTPKLVIFMTFGIIGIRICILFLSGI